MTKNGKNSGENEQGQERFLGQAYKERDTAETRDFYDDWAKVYDDEVGENDYRQPVRCAEALIAAKGNPDGRVLDIGCGTGLSGIALAKLGFSRIDGCDLSPGMLEKARATGIYDDLFECDLNQPPIKPADQTYDALAAVGVFSYGHVQADALDEFVRIAKPGAPVVIGLNDHFYQEGSLRRKIDQLAQAGKLIKLEETLGDHLPGIDLAGWVITLRTAD